MFARSLEADHRELDALYAEAAAALGSGDAAAALDRVDLFWARLAMHIRAEHLHLFPAIARGSGTSKVLERLRDDHNIFMNKLADAIKLLREANKDSRSDLSEPQAIVLGIGKMLAEHDRIEEETVYLETGDLTGAEQDELSAAIDNELANLPPRFSGGAK